MVRAVADWWDAVELWLTQLPFAFQVVLAIVVVVPVFWGVATGVDALVDRIAVLVGARVTARRARDR